MDARPVFEVDDALEGDAVEASDIFVILILPLPPRKPSTVTANTIARATLMIPNNMYDRILRLKRDLRISQSVAGSNYYYIVMKKCTPLLLIGLIRLGNAADSTLVSRKS